MEEKVNWSDYFGNTLLKSKTEKVEVNELSNYDFVLIYFSAHWCPPCRVFTPQLIKFYNNHSKNKKFEVVFVSSDKNQQEFEGYYQDMPWRALPYEEREIKNKLSKRYRVEGIPTLVVLDNRGNVLTYDARSALALDQEAASFPWKPETFWNILNKGNGTLINAKKTEVKVQDIESKDIIGLYFSAHWCGPCRAFTPGLINAYNTINKKHDKKFEIVFASWDKKEEEFYNYFGTMPWLAIPYGDERKEILSQKYEVVGIPTLILINAATGNVISKQGRLTITEDPEGKNFPWLVSNIATSGDVLNERPCFIYLNSNLPENTPKTLASVYQKIAPSWSGKEQPLYFFYGSKEELGSKIKQFCNVNQDPLLMILDMNEEKKYISTATTFDEETFTNFATDYLDGKLKGVDIR